MKTSGAQRLLVVLLVMVLASFGAWPGGAAAQEEVASALRRYKDREASTGYYEQYEVRPRRHRPLVGVPGVARGLFPYSPSAAKVRVTTRLADSHWGIKFRNCTLLDLTGNFN